MSNQKRYHYSLKKFSISARSTIDGRWKLVRQLGIGGNGEVWQCRDINDGQEYAIKFLKNAYLEPYTGQWGQVSVSRWHEGTSRAA